MTEAVTENADVVIMASCDVTHRSIHGGGKCGRAAGGRGGGTSSA